MHDNAQARIFLASERGHTETEWFRSYNSFYFGNYRDAAKIPFGPLYVLNDDTLAGHRHFSLQAEEPTDLLLLPIVGAVGCRHNGHQTIVQAGQIKCCPLEQGETIELFNPYEQELVNFLQIWIRRSTPSLSSNEDATDFDLNAHKNQWLKIAGRNALTVQTGTESQTEEATLSYHLYIAKLDGRLEIMHKAAQPDSGFFVFVIEGAFEVQHRLLEARDGLSLLGVTELEAEALSNDAILLLIELAPF